jgi:large subunit ribosomal protein L17
MNHRKFGKKLGRNTNQRKALLNSLTRSVFTHGFLNTTEAKAQAVRSQIEHLTATALKNDLSARRELFKVFQDRHWVNRIVAAITSAFTTQKLNFTKITKVKRRSGDDALVVRLDFTQAVNFQPQIAPADNQPKDAPVKKVTPKKKVTVKAAPKAVKVKKSKVSHEA